MDNMNNKRLDLKYTSDSIDSIIKMRDVRDIIFLINKEVISLWIF